MAPFMRNTCLLACLLCTVCCRAFPQAVSSYDVPEAASLLGEYIRFASVTGSEKEAGRFLASLCREKGLHVKVFTDREGAFNFAASLYPLESGRPNIVLLNHIDVVSAAAGEAGRWRHPPFSGAVADGHVWGRGAIDNKGMAIMQLLAVAGLTAEASARDLPYNVTMLSVSSEETGGEAGARLIAARHLDTLHPVVVVGEGGAGVSGVLASDPHRAVFGIEVAQKSGLQLRLSMRVASSGHGSVPPEEYAGKEMVQALDRLITRSPKVTITPSARLMFRELGKQEGGLRGFAMRHPWLLRLFGGRYLREEPLIRAMVTNTATVTGLSTPAAGSNQIAQRVTATLDCRLLPGTSQEEFIRELRATLSDRDLEIEVIAGFEPAPPSDPGNPFFGRLGEAVASVHPDALVVPILFPASNDNNYFRSKGVSAFGLLPVFLTQELLHTIHNTDERIPIAALESGVEIYLRFLRSVLGTDVKAPAEAW